MQKYMIDGAIVPNSMPSLAAARLEKILIMKYRGCVENIGKDNRDYFNELTVDAVVTEIEEVTGFVNKSLDEYGCDSVTKGKIDVAVDELFGNIVHYAYDDGKGEVIIRVEINRERRAISITFIDSGTPFNPLNSKTPNLTLPAKERKKGGLGLFIVKNTMDEVSYEFRDGHNIVTITKKLNKES